VARSGEFDTDPKQKGRTAMRRHQFAIGARRVSGKRRGNTAALAGVYVIATGGLATYPWINPQMQGQNPEDFPHVVRWKAAIGKRPSTIRADEIGKSISTTPSVAEDSRKFLFGPTAGNDR
jgi:GST-like protein